MECNKQVSINDVYKALMNINENLSKKIEGIEKNIKNLSTKIDNEVLEIKKEVQEIQKENDDLKKRLSDVERKLKSKNLILYGITEQAETNIVAIVQELLANKLGITNFRTEEISNAFRLGKKRENNIRPILVEFTTYFRKKEIIDSRRKLKGTKIYICEDLSYSERQEKKELSQALKEVKKINRTAIIKGNYIVVGENKYKIQDIRENKHVTLSCDYLSPPPSRNAISEPATPVTILNPEEPLYTEELTDKEEILEHWEETKEKKEGKQKVKKNPVQRTTSRNRNK